MKRFDKGHIYATLISSVFSSFVFVLFFGDIIIDDESAKIGIGSKLIALAALYLVAYVVRVVYAILFVRASGYELTETEIRTKTGVLAHKRSILSYAKIHAVNKKQTLPQRIFGVATLTVDSGATGNAFSAEITIIERADIVDRLMDKIKRLQAGEEAVGSDIPDGEKAPEKENLYTFSSRLKLIYSALSVGAGIFVILILAAVGAILLALGTALLKYAPDQSPLEIWLIALFLSATALVLTSIISLIAGICTSFFGYHGFKLHKNRDDIEISYGLFVRHTNNFKYRRIKALKITAGPVKRLFGYAEARLEVVGYGAESSSDGSEDSNASAPGALLPLVKASELESALERIIPAYIPDEIEHRAKSYPAFVLFPSLFIAIGFAVALASTISVMLMFEVAASVCATVALAFFGVMLIVLALTCAVKALEYANSGVTVKNSKLTVQNGAFTRRRTVILARDIIGIERITTPMRIKRGICSYTVHYFSNAMTNTVTVCNLDASVGHALESMLRD